MRKCGTALALAVLLTETLAAQRSRAACDRVCLEGFVNQHLDALVARNRFGLPLASKVRFTENAQVLEFGDGLGNVATGIGTYKMYVADPRSGQVGFLGTMRENGGPAASLRGCGGSLQNQERQDPQGGSAQDVVSLRRQIPFVPQ